MDSYNHGFTTGILLVKSVLEYIDYDMKVHKRKRSLKEYLKLMDCIIAYRVVLRDNPDCFVRCSDAGGYEVYDGRLKCVVAKDD